MYDNIYTFTSGDVAAGVCKFFIHLMEVEKN